MIESIVKRGHIYIYVIPPFHGAFGKIYKLITLGVNIKVLNEWKSDSYT